MRSDTFPSHSESNSQEPARPLDLVPPLWILVPTTVPSPTWSQSHCPPQCRFQVSPASQPPCVLLPVTGTLVPAPLPPFPSQGGASTPPGRAWSKQLFHPHTTRHSPAHHLPHFPTACGCIAIMTLAHLLTCVSTEAPVRADAP